ncbi:6-hydroxymethylpterin diphosphokinase MptE-like protein [Thermococcus litoralis]|nr:6-hydroxymethylpterin diphosphokinase MptE-like protein [Thermococcus litoralis]
MKWSEWEPFYVQILDKMGYDRGRDREAAFLLRELLLENKNYILAEDLKKRISERVHVFGAGPSLEKALGGEKFEGTLIAADGATSALLEYGITPDIIVTDLDGRFEDIKRANELGAYVVVHAHGDNMDKLRAYVPKLKNVLGTCQTEPLDIVYNFGGFTDGDRAVFLAEELGAREIILAGFDFGRIVGKWSKPYLKKHTPIWESKKKKFEIAQMLLDWLKKNGRARIINL